MTPIGNIHIYIYIHISHIPYWPPRNYRRGCGIPTLRGTVDDGLAEGDARLVKTNPETLNRKPKVSRKYKSSVAQNNLPSWGSGTILVVEPSKSIFSYKVICCYT